ncbi:MAG: DASS family sodium-coupled anion symporter [Candidatus Aenigmarchaeota archaeon]|nr:DASS family sodium-coupled anion symporter [Candidatus Aenigmarchaeota archaeon]
MRPPRHAPRWHHLLGLPFGRKERALFALAGAGLALLLATALLPWGTPQHAVLAITIGILFLWLSEFLPLHVTALLIPFLLVAFGGFEPAAALAGFFDPIIALVLGGFAIALGMQKHGLDAWLGEKLVHDGSTPRHVLLGLMAATALLSMWMANSAAAAIMLPIGLVILRENKLLPGSRWGKGVVLGIGFAATIGGLGTLVGSTPNILVAKFLNQSGIAFGFLDWLVFGLPLMAALLLGAWAILSFLFRAEIARVRVEKADRKLTGKQQQVLGVFLLTVLLWLTADLHGVNIGIVSLVPLFLLYGLGLLDTKDFHALDWPSLILIGGGISLGFAMHASGLDAVMATALGSSILGQPAILISLLVIGFGVLLTGFASNTAAAAVMIPFMIPVAALTGLDPRTLAFLAGVGVSMDFVMPAGTPPTTMAYGTGYLKLRELLLAGLLVSAMGILVGAVFSALIW